MDPFKRQLLQKYKDDIVKDLDVIFILDELYTNKVINSDEYSHIRELRNRDERVRFVLVKLIKNGDNSDYEVFKDCLVKEYPWLWKLLNVMDVDTPTTNESLEDSLSRGDVPRPPDHYVRRIELEEKVVEKLKNLPRYKILALHGMSGCGKSTLAISVLRNNPELVTINFKGIVFWLNFANCLTDDDIVAQQTKLFRRASTFYLNSSMLSSTTSFVNLTTSMSSIGSIGDSQSLSSNDWTWEVLRDKLKSQFIDNNLKESLLVLDEVNDKKVVEAFDIGCKMLVTTRDTAVVANYNPEIVKIENSFTESESMQLFASCMGLEVSRLPSKARKLHEKCKGSPFHIALISADLAENKERLIDDSGYWNKYLGGKKQYIFMSSKNTDNLMKTIDVCINSLDSKVLLLFKMLAVLPSNVEVSAEVLSRLWETPEPQVESIMKQLKSKSLISERYDNDRRNYIYEIHDLIMDYLRTCSTDEERKKCHVNFLKNYNYSSTEKPKSLIIDDGYIAFYVGYHILHSANLNNTWCLFRDLYLDLRFLGNKGRLTGPADLILDLNKYGQYIATTQLDRDFLNRIIWYIQAHGADLYRYPRTDIVQSIIQHESKGVLYLNALHTAQQYCAENELYFEFLHEQDADEIRNPTIIVNERITAVCFLGDYLLIGNVSGVVQVYHVAINKMKKEIPGNGSPVKWIGTSPVNTPRVASLTESGHVNIWYFDCFDYEAEDIIEEETENTDSSSETQTVIIEPKLEPYLSCRWLNNSEVLLTNTAKMIVLYTVRGEIHQQIDLGRDLNAFCSVPSNNDQYVILSGITNDGFSVHIVDLTSKKTVERLEETDPVLNILTVPGSDKIILLKEKEVIEHEIYLRGVVYRNKRKCKCNTIITNSDIKEDVTFITMAVNNSGTLLFLSTNESRIICIDLKTNSYAFDLENKRGNVHYMCVSEVSDDDVLLPGPDVLLTGTGDVENSAKLWYLDASYVAHASQRNGKVRLTMKYDVSFVHALSPQTPVSTASSSTAVSASSTPRRNQSFANSKEVERKLARKTLSLTLDRQALQPLNLKGISNGNDDGPVPLLAVVDEKNNIQVFRGKRVLAEVAGEPDEPITRVKISPCNQYIVYSLRSGAVIKYSLHTKRTSLIMDLNSPVQYLNFVHSTLLVAAAKNKRLMVYHMTENGFWKPVMLQTGDKCLGSQEILNEIIGVRNVNNHADRHSSLASLSSGGSSNGVNYANGNHRGSLFQNNGIVDCYWIPNLGLMTIEYNSMIKLWSPNMELTAVLKPRQSDVCISCTAFQSNILVICDENNAKFQIFEFFEEESILDPLMDSTLGFRISSCDLTSDGHFLALGLDTGEVLLWNVSTRKQLRSLKHHKSRVQCCAFSPMPDHMFINTSRAATPYFVSSPPRDDIMEKEQPPLVLVTMSAEIVWWNISHLIKAPPKNFVKNRNSISTLNSPLDPHAESPAVALNSGPVSVAHSANFFFGNHYSSSQDSWKNIWKGKRCSEGSTRKEILSCIKLSGTHAKRLRHDEKFSCFVTVDSAGHTYIMSVMRATIS